MHIVLISFYAVTNIGDKILTDCVRYFLEEKGFSTQIVDIQGRSIISKEDSEQIRLQKIKQSKAIADDRNSYEAYFDEIIRHCDAVIFAGGALLDIKMPNRAENIYVITSIANRYHKPVAFNAVGIYGDRLEGPEAKFLKSAFLLPNVVWLSARERIVELEALLDNQRVIHHCCDTAVWASEVFNVKTGHANKPIRIGINIIDKEIQSMGQNQDNDHIYSSLYHSLQQNGYVCTFFTNGVPYDYDYAIGMLERCGLPSDLLVSSCVSNNPRAFLQMIAQFDLIISSRLHTSICAYSLKVPTLCLSWDQKMEIFYTDINRKQWILQNLDPDPLFFRVNDAILQGLGGAHYDYYRSTVLENLNNICHQIKKRF